MTGRAPWWVLGLALALPASAQGRAVAVGINAPAGGLGVEYLRHPQRATVGFAVGGGIAGVGGRVQARVSERSTEDGVQYRTLSAGLLLSPWTLGEEHSPVLLEATYGVEILNDVFYGSAGGGLLVPVGGDLNGGIPLPSLRFVIGVPF